jgi:Ni/Fe-hydrogenase subunit HybB-like protein
MSHQATPVGGETMSRPVKILFAFAGLALLIIAWRFAVGLGPATGLNDGYPWGIWIAFDVVTGTALGCGGFALALLVYIFNKGKYHPMVRPAVLTAALGYSMAAIGIMIDVGKPWFIWRIPLGGFPDMGSYNWNSALLEVALCVMAYIVVLYIELSPAFFEKYEDSDNEKLANFSRKANRFMDKALIWILAAGVLLPTMHQSSLGSLMLLAGPRLHPLWHTPFLPLLFLISCITMGYAVVVMESALAARYFRRQPETDMLAKLSVVAAWTVWGYLAIRLVDLILRGRLGAMFSLDVWALMFWIETVLLVIPAVWFMNPAKRRDLGVLFRGAMLLVLSGALYRFDTYLVGFLPGENFGYFPTIPEILVTVGIVAAEVALYVVVVKNFPILAGKPAASTTAAAH